MGFGGSLFSFSAYSSCLYAAHFAVYQDVAKSLYAQLSPACVAVDVHSFGKQGGRVGSYHLIKLHLNLNLHKEHHKTNKVPESLEKTYPATKMDSIKVKILK